MTEGDVCRKVLLHRERIARLKEKYVFDQEAADRAVFFIERHMKHWKEPHAGKPFILSEWQKEDVIRPLFGLKRHDGTRLFREAYLQIARKNGKSALSAAILLVILYTDGEGLELYTAATKKDQAEIIFNDCTQFVKKSKALRRRAVIKTNSIEIPKTASVIKPLSSDTKSLDGLNVSAASIDELHAHKTPHIYDVIVTGTGARTQPLVLCPTTAGEGDHGICHDQYEYAEKVLEGAIEDDSFFCYIAEADKELKWDDPQAYRQANPNLDVSVTRDYIEQQLTKALGSPERRKSYGRYVLNRWQQAGVERWLSVEEWKACGRPFHWNSMKGMACFGGLDLSSVLDLTAFALVFPCPNDVLRVLVQFWLPEGTLAAREKSDRVPYDRWVDEGWIKTTPGGAIDYDTIVKDVDEIRKRYRVAMIAYDDWNAVQVNTDLERKGVPMVKFVQGLRSFHTPSTDFEKRISSGKIEHDGNPVLTWMVSNVKVLRDSSDKIRPVKEHKSSKNRIDGVVASIMALDCSLRFEQAKKKGGVGDVPEGFRALLGV